MTPGCALVTYAALASLALAMGRHHRSVFTTELTAARRRSRRLAGWSLLTLSLLLTFNAEGSEMGMVVWLAGLASTGLVLALLLTYRPRAWWTPLPLLALLCLETVFLRR